MKKLAFYLMVIMCVLVGCNSTKEVAKVEETREIVEIKEEVKIATHSNPYCTNPNCDMIDCKCGIDGIDCCNNVVEETKPKKEYKKVMTELGKFETLKNDEIECVDSLVLSNGLKVNEEVELFWYDENRYYQSMIVRVKRRETNKIIFEEIVEEE